MHAHIVMIYSITRNHIYHEPSAFTSNYKAHIHDHHKTHLYRLYYFGNTGKVFITRRGHRADQWHEIHKQPALQVHIHVNTLCCISKDRVEVKALTLVLIVVSARPSSTRYLATAKWPRPHAWWRAFHPSYPWDNITHHMHTSHATEHQHQSYTHIHANRGYITHTEQHTASKQP